MSPAWFWVEELSGSGSLVLSAEESRHVGSRRLRRGDAVVLFDGAGRTAPGRIGGGGRKAVEVDVESVELAPPPRDLLGLATAIPKGDRLGTMLQMSTQLGLEVWQPLVLENSAVRKLDPGSARIRRILLEACKVARRPWALRILPPLSLEASLAAVGPSSSLFFGDHAGEATAPAWDADSRRGWVFIGPEAGFSERERERLGESGASALRFSDYNLRIETAAVAAMAAFNVSGRPSGARD